MNRGSLLNEFNAGLHARSRFLNFLSARKIISSWIEANGYNRPSSDTCSRVLALPHLCQPMGFNDYEFKINSAPDLVDSLGQGNVIDEVVPWIPLRENWTLSKVTRTLQDNRPLLDYQISTGLSRNVKCTLNGKKGSYHITCRLYRPYGKNKWSVFFNVGSPGGSVEPEDDTALIKNTGELAQEWVRLMGFQHLVQKLNPKAETGKGWAFTASTSLPIDGDPFLYIGTDHHPAYQKVTPARNRVPGDYTGILPETPSIEAHGIDFDLAIELHRLACGRFFGPETAHGELHFRFLDGQLQDFKRVAEPIFGTPWLQCMGGFGAPGDVLRIHEGIADWTIQMVAYFKILGNWRTIDLVKEPGGWRFHVTGKYTKDPLKHRHIRDELARKAGMTSETLWEPQEVGEGWLGVPG